jgi:TonB-dependent receptor
MAIGTSYFQNKRAYAILLIFYLLFQSLSVAGSGSIKGRILDKESGAPLIGANIMLMNTNTGGSSDAEGNFYIYDVSPGEQILKVSYLGYNSITVKVTVAENKALEQDFRLEAGVIMGETVTITAQAQGQLSVVNQQLSSNTIANIVSKDRIKELPDVNAAESIGRLPGVLINRYGGEATQISIRGLSPKYNTVTVNGVALPAIGGDDRSADLSLISSNMLDGIELKKAVTPDMDADATGGTVDLKLKEASEGLQIKASAQYGYSDLQKYYGNYNFNAYVSNRFLDSDLGVIASFNMDHYDRSADKFSANYKEQLNTKDNLTEVWLQDLNLREEKMKRGRTGAGILLDYHIPYGKVSANAFYNSLEGEGLNHIDQMNITTPSAGNRQYFNIEQRGGTTSIFTGDVGIKQDFNWISYDASVARTTSRTRNLGERTWSFVCESNAFTSTAVNAAAQPIDIPARAKMDTNSFLLASAVIISSLRKSYMRRPVLYRTSFSLIQIYTMQIPGELQSTMV